MAGKPTNEGNIHGGASRRCPNLSTNVAIF